MILHKITVHVSKNKVVAYVKEITYQMNHIESHPISEKEYQYTESSYSKLIGRLQNKYPSAELTVIFDNPLNAIKD